MINKSSQRMMSITNHLIYSNSSSAVEFHKQLALPKLVLNKPKVLNSVNLDMIRQISAIVPQIQKQSKAFWMEGAGGKAFCAGGDVKSLFDENSSYEDRQTFFREQFICDYKVATSKSIQIANWDGIVMGGGIGLSISAPFRIATEKTMLAMPEGKIGFYTDVGTSYFLAKMRSNIGLYIALTASRLKGEDVYKSGFANFYVARQNIGKIYQEISKQIKQSTNASKTIEGIIKKYNVETNGHKISNEDEINYIFGGQSVQQIYQRAKEGKGQFSESVVKSLDQVCPLSLHTCFKLIKTVGNMSYRQCFVRDFVIAQNFCANANFKEGVISLLVKKNNNPQWTHKSLADVKQSEVQAMFRQIPQRSVLDI